MDVAHAARASLTLLLSVAGSPTEGGKPMRRRSRQPAAEWCRMVYRALRRRRASHRDVGNGLSERYSQRWEFTEFAAIETAVGKPRTLFRRGSSRDDFPHQCQLESTGIYWSSRFGRKRSAFARLGDATCASGTT